MYKRQRYRRAARLMTRMSCTFSSVPLLLSLIHILPAAGEHNVRNALAALAVADAVGVPQEAAAHAVAQYEPCLLYTSRCV